MSLVLSEEVHEDDRPLYKRGIRARHVCMSYPTWQTLQLELEETLVTRRRTIVLCDLDDRYLSTCMSWIRDAQRRGFKIANVVIVDSDENFLIHKVE
jgi:hypothetical protein